MAEQVIKKAKQILEGLEVGHFETCKDWSPHTYEDFYLYFSDSNYETRKLSTLVFAAAIGNTRRGAAHILKSDREISDYTSKGQKRNFYSFEKYVTSFLNNKELLNKEFPVLYKFILSELSLWNEEQSFSITFPDLDKKLFKEIIEILNGINIDNLELDFNFLLKEMEWSDSTLSENTKEIILGPDGKLKYLP